MESALKSLKKLLDSIQPIGDDDWTAFSAIWKPFSCKRKEIITSVGDKERYLYFIIEGVQRIYYYDDKNREATLVFTYSPSFGGVLDSMMLNISSRYFYEALTNSSFIRAPIEEVWRVMDSSHQFHKVITLGLSQALSGLLERVVELQCFSSEEKFRKLLARSPHLLKLIPHKYIANYLGIDPTNFSKLMNKVRI